MKKGLIRFIATAVAFSLLLDPVTASAFTGPLPMGAISIGQRSLFENQALEPAARLSGLQVLLHHTPGLFHEFQPPVKRAQKRLLGQGLLRQEEQILAYRLIPSLDPGNKGLSFSKAESLVDRLTAEQLRKTARIIHGWIIEEKNPNSAREGQIIRFLKQHIPFIIAHYSTLIDLLLS